MVRKIGRLAEAIEMGMDVLLVGCVEGVMLAAVVKGCRQRPEAQSAA
jgi:hypothetical protein